MSKRSIQYDKFFVIDLEATCWDDDDPVKGVSEIIEIGITEVDNRTKQRMGKRSILIKPTQSTISNYCTELTSITQEMLDQHGVGFARACKILFKDLGTKYRVWWSWGEYDRHMLMRQCQEAGIDYPMGPHINAKSLFALKKGAKKGTGMKKALRAYDITLEGRHHRGHDDAWNTAAIIIKMLS